MSNQSPLATIEYNSTASQYLDLAKRFHRSMRKTQRFNNILNLLALSCIIMLITAKLYLLISGQKSLPSLLGGFTGFSAISLLFIITYKVFFYIGILGFFSDRKKFSKKIEGTQPFKYQIYSDHIAVNEPYQQGNFSFDSFENISLYNECLSFIFCPHVIKGYEWTKNLNMLIIPIEAFSGQEKIFDYLRQLSNFYDCRQ